MEWFNQYDIGEEVRVNAYGGAFGTIVDINYEDQTYDVKVDGEIDTYGEDDLS